MTSHCHALVQGRTNRELIINKISTVFNTKFTIYVTQSYFGSGSCKPNQTWLQHRPKRIYSRRNGQGCNSRTRKIAEAEHAKGNPFQVGIFTGASTGESCDGVLSRAKAIRYRAPYTTNADFRKAVNNGEIAYNDIHLSQMAQEVRYGFMGKVNVAIIEACEVTPDGKFI